MSATVTDPNGIPYANGTVKAQLVLAGAGVTGQPTVTNSNAQQCASAGKGSAPCQIEFPGTVGPFLMDQNGSFTVALQDNALVTPASTQWLFTVGITPGIPPPGGTGPRSFTVTLTITGASQDISTQLSSASPVLSFGGGYSGENIARRFGVKADGKACFGNIDTVTITNASSTVSCNNANFTSADVGKDIFGSNGCCGVGASFQGTLRLTRGTIVSVTNSTTVIASTVGVAGGCTGAGCILIWGTNDDAAWTIAENTWSIGSTGRCEAMIVPSGMSLIRQPHLNNPGTSCNLGAEPAIDITATVQGYGPGTSILVLEPDFNLAACTFGGGSNGCFFSFIEANIEGLALWGGGVGNTGTNAKYLMNPGLGSHLFSVNCVAFGGSDGALIGIKLGNSNFIQSAIDGCGRTGIEVTAVAFTLLLNVFSGDTLSHGIIVDAGAVLMGTQVFTGPSGVNTLGIQVLGTYFGNQDVCFPGGGFNGAGCITVESGGVAYLSQGKFQNTGTTTGFGIRANSGKVFLSSSLISGGTSGGASVQRLGTGVVFDLGGNNYTTTALTVFPTCVMTTGGGTGPACAISNSNGNEGFDVVMTPGTTPGSLGTTTVTYAGTFQIGTNLPNLTCMLKNGTGVWNARSSLILTTDSATAPVFTWDSNGVVLTAGLTYIFKCYAKAGT
ncbi:MAG: hypothetical protein ACREVZ_00350 [Burkholderiales bacterium]